MKKEIEKKHIFVIQKHWARNLHYDFRLEVEGVLASWAIPKEPKNSQEKRLAIMVEDHALEYANFSGKISEGSYGAGKVEIWDKGNYENLKEKTMKECIKKGQIEINLKGKRLNGNFALIRFKGKNNWLFFKMKNPS